MYIRVGQRSLGDKIIATIYLSLTIGKVIYITALQLNNKGDVKDSGSNKIIDISL